MEASTGSSAPVNRPRDAIPVPHRSLISYPSQETPRLLHALHIGRARSHFLLTRLQVQHPSRDRWRGVDMPNKEVKMIKISSIKSS